MSPAGEKRLPFGSASEETAPTIGYAEVLARLDALPAEILAIGSSLAENGVSPEEVLAWLRGELPDLILKIDQARAWGVIDKYDLLLAEADKLEVLKSQLEGMQVQVAQETKVEWQQHALSAQEADEKRTGQIEESWDLLETYRKIRLEKHIRDWYDEEEVADEEEAATWERQVQGHMAERQQEEAQLELDWAEEEARLDEEQRQLDAQEDEEPEPEARKLKVSPKQPQDQAQMACRSSRQNEVAGGETEEPTGHIPEELEELDPEREKRRDELRALAQASEERTRIRDTQRATVLARTGAPPRIDEPKTPDPARSRRLNLDYKGE